MSARTVTFAPAHANRALDEVTRQVRDLVQRGELAPGDRLPAERDLAEQFGLSRNTVREALRMLETSGIIELRKGSKGGAFIAVGDPRVVSRSMTDMMQLQAFPLEDLTEARLWIESTVVRVACERGTDADFDRLQANIDTAARLSSEGEWDAKAIVHIEFHGLLAEATGNAVLVLVMHALMEVIRDMAFAAGISQDDAVIRSRRRLLKCLRARDADAAVAEMEKHLRRLHRVWMASVDQGEDVTLA